MFQRMLNKLYTLLAGASLAYVVLVLVLFGLIEVGALYFAGPAIAGIIGLVFVFIILSPVFPVPLKNRAMVASLCIVLGIGIFRLAMGDEFLQSVGGVWDAAKRDKAVQYNISEEKYETYQLKKGTPLYVLKDKDVVEYKGKMKIDLMIRLMPGIEEVGNIKYRWIKFPRVDGDEFKEGIYDSTSMCRLVTLSYLGQSEREKEKVRVVTEKERLATKQLAAIEAAKTGVTADGEVRINLVPNLYASGQTFEFIKMPDARYEKIVLTETIRVRSTGSDLTNVFAHFGAQTNGRGRIKRTQNFGYVDFEKSYRAKVFMVLPKGSIIEFGSLQDKIIWFSCNGNRMIIESKVFAYKEYKEI